MYAYGLLVAGVLSGGVVVYAMLLLEGIASGAVFVMMSSLHSGMFFWNWYSSFESMLYVRDFIIIMKIKGIY
jgi:hypothetical protein